MNIIPCYRSSLTTLGNRTTYSRAILSLKFTLGFSLLFFVLTRIKWSDVSTIFSLTPKWLAAAFLFFMAMQIFAIYRVSVLLRPRVSFSQIIYLCLVKETSTLISGIAGVASFIGALRLHTNQKTLFGLQTLFITKMGDLLASALLLLWGLRFVDTEPFVTINHIVLVLAGFLGLSIVLFSLVNKFPAGLSSRLPPKLTSHIGNMSVPKIPPMSSIMVTVLSFPIITLSVAFSYSILHCFGIEIDLLPVILVSISLRILAHVPIHVLGGLGTYEFSAYYLYTAFVSDTNLLSAALIAGRVFIYLCYIPLIAYVIFVSWKSNGIQ